MTEEESFDADQRQLCSDGACTGVIGDDGKCKECGQKAQPTASGEAPREPEAQAADQAEFKAERGDHIFDDDERALCSDGACIGVLNSQGVCKVCGKPASS